jgi:hypothetical protein
MAFFIPISSDAANFDIQVTLEEVTYTLEFRWNVRLGAWFMNILDAEGVTMLRAGTRVVVNWPLNAYGANRQPPGALVAVDTTQRGEDPGLDDLGERVQLIYVTTDELEEAASEADE